VTGRTADVLGEVTAVTHIATRQDMAHWTREHADAPGINWSVEPGPGGTMLIVEHTRDRSSLNRPDTAAQTRGRRNPATAA
jgi:hypothetical protein